MRRGRVPLSSASWARRVVLPIETWDEFVHNNPLLKLKPEEIRQLRFGEAYVEYHVRAGAFKVTFQSPAIMALAVEEWMTEASRRREFFRLEVMKRLCPPGAPRRSGG